MYTPGAKLKNTFPKKHTLSSECTSSWPYDQRRKNNYFQYFLKAVLWLYTLVEYIRRTVGTAKPLWTVFSRFAVGSGTGTVITEPRWGLYGLEKEKDQERKKNQKWECWRKISFNDWVTLNFKVKFTLKCAVQRNTYSSVFCVQQTAGNLHRMPKLCDLHLQLDSIC